jgi:hypothetical protein
MYTTDFGRTGGQAAWVEAKAWVDGPEDEETWCLGVTFTFPDGTKRTEEQDCPSWTDHLLEVDAETACEDLIYVTIPGEQVVEKPCPVAFQQTRSWGSGTGRWYGHGQSQVIVDFMRGSERIARRYFVIVVPGE